MQQLELHAGLPGCLSWIQQQRAMATCELQQQLQQQLAVQWGRPQPPGNGACIRQVAHAVITVACFCSCATTASSLLLGDACFACWAARIRRCLEGSTIKHRWLRKVRQQQQWPLNCSTVAPSISLVVCVDRQTFWTCGQQSRRGVRSSSWLADWRACPISVAW